jgi:hypothetical protein
MHGRVYRFSGIFQFKTRSGAIQRAIKRLEAAKGLKRHLERAVKFLHYQDELSYPKLVSL